MKKSAAKKIYSTLLRLTEIGAHLSHALDSDMGALDAPSSIFMIHTAKRLRIEGLVVNGVMTVSRWDQSPELKKKILSDITRRSRLHVENNIVIADLFERLHAAGVNPILLKGQSLVDIYPSPEMRAVGDIDIYIRPEEWSAVMEVISALPLDTHDRLPRSAAELPKRGKHVEMVYRGKSVELHYLAADLIDQPDLDAEFRRFIADEIERTAETMHINSRGEIGNEGVEVRRLGTTMNAFYIFHHLWGHISVGLPKLRAFPDMMLFLERHRMDIDLVWLEQTLERFRLMDHWQTVGAWLVGRLGMNDFDVPFYDPDKGRAARALDSYLAETTRMALTDTSQLGAFGRRWHNMKSYARRAPALFGIFPARKAMADTWRLFYMGFRNIFNK